MSMKSKSAKSVKNSKADIADKIREIKQKQHNWLKQRDVSNKQQISSITDFKEVKSVQSSSTLNQPRITKSSSSLSSASATSTQFSPTSTSPNKSSLPAVAKTYTKFKKKTVETRSEDHLLNSAQHTDLTHTNNDTVTGEADVADEQGQSGRCAPMAPELFDTLADKIVMRVKHELKIDHNRYIHKSSVPYREIHQDENQGDSECDELGEQLGESGYGLDSHRCHACSQVMNPPGHTPMLVIPCGHTYCVHCLEGSDICPGCKCSIQSLTCNIMLQQIITEYVRRKDARRERRTPSRQQSERRATPRSNEYSASNYMEANDVDIKEQYKTLLVRCEVLECEKDDINESMHQIDRQIELEQRQITGIKKSEDKIKMEIKNLETRLDDLQKHKKDYGERIMELERKKDQNRRRMTMVDQTLKGITNDMKKVNNNLE